MLIYKKRQMSVEVPDVYIERANWMVMDGVSILKKLMTDTVITYSK